MKKQVLRRNFWIRFGAFFLMVFLFIGLAASTVSVVYMAGNGYYYDNGENDRESIRARSSLYYAILGASETFYAIDESVVWAASYYYDTSRYLELENVDYSVKDIETGKILFTSYSPDKPYLEEYTNDIAIRYMTDDSPEELSRELSVTVYFPHELPHQDWCTVQLKLSGILTEFKYPMIALAVILLIAGIALFIFLMQSAGLSADGTPTPGFLGRVPIEVFAVIISLLETGVVGVTVFLNESADTYIGALAFFLLFTFILALWLLMSLASRFRSNTFFKYCLTWIIIKALGRLFRWIGRIYHKAGFLWRSAIAICVVSFVFLILVIGVGERVDIAPFFMFCLWFCLTAAFSVACANFSKLKKAIQRLADGDYTTKVSTAGMFFDFRRAAQNINRAGEGMTKAVEERMKSERLKTELITNVSHDIKTPLTSIVNCVDLLKNSGEEYSAQTAEYLDILDRQSKRLKKLTEDVLEASKASTGNIAVELGAVDMGTLLTQAMGEYSDKLEEKNLKPVINISQENILAYADGRLLWRVFDNLFSNIIKYALPGTRVYLDVFKANGIAYVTFRNVSEFELPGDPAELTERFVRGDASRNTEGSGLGLSISENLCTLMGGKLTLSTEADLFKATVSLPACRLVPKKQS